MVATRAPPGAVGQAVPRWNLVWLVCGFSTPRELGSSEGNDGLDVVYVRCREAMLPKVVDPTLDRYVLEVPFGNCVAMLPQFLRRVAKAEAKCSC